MGKATPKIDFSEAEWKFLQSIGKRENKTVSAIVIEAIAAKYPDFLNAEHVVKTLPPEPETPPARYQLSARIENGEVVLEQGKPARVYKKTSKRGDVPISVYWDADCNWEAYKNIEEDIRLKIVQFEMRVRWFGSGS